MLDYMQDYEFGERVALVDGDILVYRAASLSEELGAPQLSFDIVAGMMTRFADTIGTTDLLVFLSSDFNVRRYFYPEYKANRKGNKPKFFNEVMEYVKTFYECCTVEGLEADDAIVAAAYENIDIWEKGVYIVSLDKDLRQVPNTVFYNMVTGATEFITEDIAYRNILLQCLTGDKVDNISGLKGIGKKKAEKLIDGIVLNSLDDVYNELIKIYLKFNHTEADVNAVYNCIVMQNDLDQFTYKGIPQSFTVEDVKQRRLDDYIYTGRLPNIPIDRSPQNEPTTPCDAG